MKTCINERTLNVKISIAGRTVDLSKTKYPIPNYYFAFPEPEELANAIEYVRGADLAFEKRVADRLSDGSVKDAAKMLAQMVAQTWYQYRAKVQRAARARRVRTDQVREKRQAQRVRTLQRILRTYEELSALMEDAGDMTQLDAQEIHELSKICSNLGTRLRSVSVTIYNDDIAAAMAEEGV